MEFSKQIYLLNVIIVAVTTIVTFLIILFSGQLQIIDLSPLSVICTSAFASLGVSSICYYRKSQAENVIKISKQIQEENIEIQNVEVANQIMNSDFHNPLN